MYRQVLTIVFVIQIAYTLALSEFLLTIKLPMLIVMLPRSLIKLADKMSIRTLGQFAITGILLISSACSDQRSENKPISTEKRIRQADPDSEATNTIIDQGFYQQSLDTSLSDQDSTKKPPPRSIAKGQPLNSRQPENEKTDATQDEFSTKANTKTLTNNPKSFVEDLGFSGAEQGPIETSIETPFCLDTSAVFENEETINNACRRISDRLASVTYKACLAAKLQPTGCDSVNGFPILVREFEPLKTRLPQGRILVIGGTHGDELTSVSVTLRWIDKLNKYHSGLFHWHIAPMMNPDGVLKRAATRTNSNGVDLNRNMPSEDWDRNAIKYWTEKSGKNPRRYPGQRASSEPETQWLVDEINDFKPDAIISVHAPYGVVDFDSLLLNTAPKSLGKLRLNLLGTYPGSLGNYAGINRDIPVITLELPHSWVMPSDIESTRIWEDIVSWLKRNVNKDLIAN